MGPRDETTYGGEPAGPAPSEFPEFSGLAKGAPSSLLEENWLPLLGERAKTSLEAWQHHSSKYSDNPTAVPQRRLRHLPESLYLGHRVIQTLRLWNTWSGLTQTRVKQKYHYSHRLKDR